MGAKMEKEKKISRSEKKKRMRLDVWKKTNRACAHCGKKVARKNWTIDHYIPRKYFGGNDIRNLMPLCEECNIKKDDTIVHPRSYYKYASLQSIWECEEYKEDWAKDNPEILFKLQKKGILIPEETYPLGELLQKDRTRAIRRKKNASKAMRKKAIDMQIHVNTPWYGSLHQYSKNKIHCSCPMCAFNPKRHGRRFLKYQYTAQDMRNMEKQDFSEKEYLQMAV